MLSAAKTVILLRACYRFMRRPWIERGKGGKERKKEKGSGKGVRYGGKGVRYRYIFRKTEKAEKERKRGQIHFQ
jgi:hypothetical protein